MEEKTKPIIYKRKEVKYTISMLSSLLQKYKKADDKNLEFAGGKKLISLFNKKKKKRC